MNRASRPSRRSLLAATATAAGLAGCLDRVGLGPLPVLNTTDSPRAADLATFTACDTRAQPWRAIDASREVPTEAIEPAQGDLPRIESPPARYFCRRPRAPDGCLEEATDVRVVSSRAVGAGAPLTMTPSTDRLVLPGTLTCTLTNRTTEPFQTNFYARKLWKRVDGRWYHVYPQGHVQPATALGPGERLRYCLHLDNESYQDEHLHSIQQERNDSADSGGGDNGGGGGAGEGDDGGGGGASWSEVVPALGGGEYAFALFGEIAPPDEIHDASPTGAVARFTLVGDPIDLTTTSHVEDVSVEDDRVTARWTYFDGERTSTRGRFTVRRAEDVEHPRPLITEQIVRMCRNSPLRDALALYLTHDVDEVAIEGESPATPTFACPHYPVEYDGARYAVENETLERFD